MDKIACIDIEASFEIYQEVNNNRVIFEASLMNFDESVKVKLSLTYPKDIQFIGNDLRMIKKKDYQTNTTLKASIKVLKSNVCSLLDDNYLFIAWNKAHDMDIIAALLDEPHKTMFSKRSFCAMQRFSQRYGNHSYRKEFKAYPYISLTDAIDIFKLKKLPPHQSINDVTMLRDVWKEMDDRENIIEFENHMKKKSNNA